MPQALPRSRQDCRRAHWRSAARRAARGRPPRGWVSLRSKRPPFANRILARGPDGVTTNSNANSAPAYREFWKSPASNRPPGGESFVDQIARAGAGLAALPAGEAILVVHSGTIRAVLAIALDLAPEQRAALRDRSAVADADRSAGERLARGCGQYASVSSGSLARRHRYAESRRIAPGAARFRIRSLQKSR